MIKWTLLAFITASNLVYADCQMQEDPELKCRVEKDQINQCGFYIKAGSGVSASTKSSVSAPLVIWDSSAQGYNSRIGTVPIFLVGLGYDSPFVSTDFTISYRPDFKYKKYQTPTNEGTVGELGTTTRRFNLDVFTLMYTVYLNGRGWRYLNWKAGEASSVYPVIAGGIGGSRMMLYNFRSTGLPPVTGGFPSFASENQYSVKYKFTYQVMAGFEYRYRDVCALSVGYRWFDVSRFNGPRYLRNAEGQALDIQSDVWKITFSCNEAFIEFKILL